MSLTPHADRNLHQRLLDHLSTAVVLLDAHFCLCYLNPAAEMLLGSSAQRVLGSRLPDGFFTDPEARSAFERCLTDGHPFTRREAHIVLPSAQEIVVDYSVSPLQQGRAVMLMEIIPLDRMLRIAREEGLVHAHQATRALVRGVAHEIKNPLGGIRGAAQLLERELPDPALREYTRVIIGEADRLQVLADRMLGPRRPPQFCWLNIHECLEHVRQLVLAEFPAVAWVRDYDTSLPDIPADRDQLVQVILNLVRNAAQALTEHPVATPRILLRTRVQRQTTIGNLRHRMIVRLDIEDNGPGIVDELRETLFYPLVSGRAQGAGLGLSIAQSIVSQHQALIECHSEPGRTCFSVLLPMEAPSREGEHRP
ncbi:nitrogen regulation protein NR(II) [Isoalcanivorax beigongshangi]|uniref:Sensory histidine kinase/phosphatase NtrB n=1 Tax=Isoalcanivorax beigongshangi TaxID=3238810 RepID=A0ABV4AJG1_9GAMM